jgi:cytochrome P450
VTPTDVLDTAGSDVYYDPYDFGIDENPYPLWKRMRDEAPLYYNSKYDFYAVTRFDDVDRVSADWPTFSSAKGTLLELIKSGYTLPPGNPLFEDPPAHDVHRSAIAKLFRVRTIAALEPKIREFCVQSLDQFVGAEGFDFITDIGTWVPMRAIGYLLGIPESDQRKIREMIDEGLRLEEGSPNMEHFDPRKQQEKQDAVYREYIEWRQKNPSDDLITELLNAEYEDVDGQVKKLSTEEIVTYVNMLSSAGNETTTRLIGWYGKLLAENPDQRRLVVNDLGLVNNTIEETLRYEAPSPVQSRYVTADAEFHGQTVPAGSVLMMINGSANRDERHYEDPDRYNVQRKIDRHLSFGYGLHFCQGAALARLEGRVVLEEILKRWPEWEVDYANAEQAHTSTVRGWNKLPVKFA